jgi:CRP/FNR family transcriptional regulator, anaerobic regulatory protein
MVQKLDRVISYFPALGALAPEHLAFLGAHLHFPTMQAGDIAYEPDQECPNYLMCLEGRTRVFKLSASGREMLIYKVVSGGTCVLTTQCLLTGGTFPAGSIAEAATTLAAIPGSAFRRLMADSDPFRAVVMTDYTRLLTSLFTLIDEVAFAPLEQRLARRLLAEAEGKEIVVKTHQQLADDVGSVREMVSRHLGEWERAGWVRTGRGHIEILDRFALASRRATAV